MSQIENIFSEKFITYLQSIANEGINNAAKGFSMMLGCSMDVTEPSVRTISLEEIPDMLGGPENEAVGIYLRAEGDIPTQIMMVIPFDKANHLVDLLMAQEEGTTTTLGRLERSALAEVGNLTGTFFMNSVAKALNLDLRPTPPAVMVDMVGAILDIIAATTGGVGNNVLILETKFVIGERKVAADFWVIPDHNTLEVLDKRL